MILDKSTYLADWEESCLATFGEVAAIVFVGGTDLLHSVSIWIRSSTRQAHSSHLWESQRWSTEMVAHGKIFLTWGVVDQSNRVAVTKNDIIVFHVMGTTAELEWNLYGPTGRMASWPYGPWAILFREGGYFTLLSLLHGLFHFHYPHKCGATESRICIWITQSQGNQLDWSSLPM